jgi:hypothetical protein
MIIHLNERRFDKLFLTESKNSKRADKQTMQLIAQRSGWDINDNRVANTQWFFRKVYFGSEGLNDDWFIVLEPNFCAAAIDKGMLNGDTDGVYNDLLDLIKYAHRKAKELIETKGREAMLQYISELKGNINSWDTLYEMVGKALEYERQEAMEKANQTQESESEYKVIGPVDFAEAREYGDYTAYQDGGEICYTQAGSTWNQYTKNDAYSVYILVKPRWGEIPDEHDDEYEESPYDTYGMSMIFVIVDEEGNLKTCNTRWNHEASYKGKDVDFALDEVQLSELVGRPFKEVFKPKTPLTFEEKVEEILYKVNNWNYDEEGDFDILFSDFREYEGNVFAVKVYDKWNFLRYDVDEDVYRFVSNQWFDAVGYYTMVDENYGVALVLLKGCGYNFVKNDGTYLFDEWLRGADNFRGRHSMILKGGQTYITDIYGNLYNDKEEIFADVAKGGKSVLKKVDSYEYYGSNYYKIILFGRENILFNGRLLSPDLWFHEVFITDASIAARRFPVIYSEGNYPFQCNYLKTEGGLLLPNWVDKVSTFKYTYHFYAEIKDNGETYCIDINGNKISE